MSTTGHATPTDNMNFPHGKGRLAVFSEISPENDSEEDLSEDEIAELGLHMQKSSLLTSATSRDIMNTPPTSAVLDEEIKFEDCKVNQVQQSMAPRGNKKTNKAKRKYALKTGVA